MANSSLTIFGAGLIGGSIALAARKSQAFAHIIAIDKNPSPDFSPFDAWIAAEDEGGIRSALAQSNLTLLCTPVGSIIALLPTVLDHCGGWVSDCGSTKQAIIESVVNHPRRAHFVAGHPMAGHPQGGIENAREDLFENRKWILCPERSAPEALSELEGFVSSLGACPVKLSASEHDKSVAHTSHLPQVVASALWVQAARQDALQAAGPGFASATRVAGGAESMWRDIFETNGPAIGQAMQHLGKTLLEVGKELEQKHPEASLEILARARALRQKT